MKEVSINVPSTGFPDQFATDREKASLEYGLLVGQSIQYEWFRKDGGGCRYYDQWKQFHKLRLYARGEQSVQKYKDELAVDGDLSYLNLDWTPVPILPKFVDIVVNGMTDRMFKVKATAQDAMSSERRNKFQENIETQMAGKDVFNLVQSDFGVNPYTMNPDDVPDNDEELSLYMQLNYKPAIEIAEEVAINTILEQNSYQDIRKRLDYDQMVIGIEIAKHTFQKGGGIVVDYVDPANVVYSYTEDPYFKDCFYWGEVKTMALTELIKIDPDLTKEDMELISKSSSQWATQYNLSQMHENDLFYRDTCTLLYFNYKTTKSFVYKKKTLEGGGERVIEKDDEFNPPSDMMEEGNFEKVSKTVEVWYEGIMVMGTSIVLSSTGGASKMQLLISNYNHYLDMIRAVTGLNEARDGSTPDPNSLVGVQKLAALNSNTATRHILESSLYVLRTLSEALSYRVADLLEYSDFREEFLNQIGNYNVSTLEQIKDLPIASFGIFIEIAPDEEQRAQLEANIQVALSRDNINLEDAIDIREVKNIKLANQLLKVKRKKKDQATQQQAMQSQQMQAQTQMQVQQMAAQSAQQNIQMEMQAKAQLEQVKTDMGIKKLDAEAKYKLMLMEREFEMQMQLQGAAQEQIQKREDTRETEKAKRIDKQNTQQSKLIDQRKNNLPPLSFESNEDSLDGFDLAEFSPR
jgi:hypothetical protein